MVQKWIPFNYIAGGMTYKFTIQVQLESETAVLTEEEMLVAAKKCLALDKQYPLYKGYSIH